MMRTAQEGEMNRPEPENPKQNMTQKRDMIGDKESTYYLVLRVHADEIVKGEWYTSV